MTCTYMAMRIVRYYRDAGFEKKIRALSPVNLWFRLGPQAPLLFLPTCGKTRVV